MWVPVPLAVVVAGPPSSRLGMSAADVVGAIPEPSPLGVASLLPPSGLAVPMPPSSSPGGMPPSRPGRGYVHKVIPGSPPMSWSYTLSVYASDEARKWEYTMKIKEDFPASPGVITAPGARALLKHEMHITSAPLRTENSIESARKQLFIPSGENSYLLTPAILLPSPRLGDERR